MRSAIRLEYASAFHQPCEALPSDRAVARAVRGGIAGLVLGVSLLGSVGLGLMLGMSGASRSPAAISELRASASAEAGSTDRTLEPALTTAGFAH